MEHNMAMRTKVLNLSLYTLEYAEPIIMGENKLLVILNCVNEKYLIYM